MPVIAVDIHGGTKAPIAPVAAAAEISRTTEIDVILVGDMRIIDDLLSRVPYNPERLSTHYVPAESTVATCAELVRSRQAHALVTAGDPPTVLRTCVNSFTLVPGLRRAPLAAVYPTAPRPGNRDPFALILDVGATLQPNADDLVQWAKMGVGYASRISKVEAPTIGLLSTSADPLAGPAHVVEAHRRLAADTSVRFVGNVSGLDVPRGAADVVVCDGFTGQIILQLLGGIGDSIMNAASQAWERRMSWRMGLRLLEGAVVRFHELITHNAYGGAPLLGFDQVAILALQSSDSAALQNAIKLAAKAYRENIPGVSADALSVSLP